MEKTLRTLKRIIPLPLFRFFEPAYHYSLAFIGALYYRFPSRRIKVVAVTGTKGKTSTVEFINAILEADGQKTAVASTLRFKIGRESERNLFKMTTPGRFFLQHFFARAIKEHCTWVVAEISSEAAKHYRHRFIDLDAVVVTNISPEHIEAHGSFENYISAKVSIARRLEAGHKRHTFLVVNGDNKWSGKFLGIKADVVRSYSCKNIEPFSADEHGIRLTYDGVSISSPLPGAVNVYNILAAAEFASSLGISPETIKEGIESVREIRGRFERIDLGQKFIVLVDYAHTPDSLESAYAAFKEARKVCVLGATGGGRDKWKRAEMGRVADNNCAEVIITNEDPYDEDPDTIIRDVAAGVTGKEPRIIRDRRVAIRTALEHARAGDVVFVTGKGTDPYIMGPNGSKEEWSDRDVTEQELKKVLKKK